jgi:hypothetical protein
MPSILQHNRPSISFGAEHAAPTGREGSMRFVPRKKIAVAGILAAAAGGLLIASFAPASVSAPRAGTPVSEATVSPSALMMQAPRNLPVEQYDSH